MNDYKKKKQLLDENKDMYISEHDKALSYEALSQIVDAKKRYKDAAVSDNKEAMTKANNDANAVRAKYGSYTGGEFGDEYHPLGNVYDNPAPYSSKYEDELDRLYESIIADDEPFFYNVEDDPVYKAYKSVYEKEGDLAFERALASNSLKTNGVENSHARSAAAQAMGYYSSLLAEKVPELYEAAYRRYYKDIEDKSGKLKDAYDAIIRREERDYDRYSDGLDIHRDMRDFAYKRERDNLDRAYEIQRDYEDREHDKELRAMSELSDNTARKQEMMYKILRNDIEDEKWVYENNLNAHKAQYSPYTGSIGKRDILDYARKLFGRPSLTADDLMSLMGL